MAIVFSFWGRQTQLPAATELLRRGTGRRAPHSRAAKNLSRCPAQVMAEVMNTKAALTRVKFLSRTGAVATALLTVLRPAR